jgi:hypothetical protein
MGLGCMRGLVEKFGEKLVNEALDIFEGILENVEDSDAQVGVCRVLMNMASAASYRLISAISSRLMNIMDTNIASSSAEIRDYAVMCLSFYSEDSLKTYSSKLNSKKLSCIS